MRVTAQQTQKTKFERGKVEKRVECRGWGV
jgi:hypothetical protein